MFSLNELKGILKPYFKIDNRRLDCLVQILISLITVRTVNLVEAERIEVFEKFIRIFGSDFIKDLVADREFASSEWFKWLDKRRIPFSIRIKKNALVDSSKGNNLHVRRLFINLKPGQTRFLSKKKDIFGISLWLAATRAQDGEWVIVATNHEHENALIRYKLRWNIETLFGFLKSKGFNFEDTHITAHERLHNLLSVLTLAFCLAYKTGQIVVDEIPIKNKKHGRPEKSVLRDCQKSLHENTVCSILEHTAGNLKKAYQHRSPHRM